MQALWQSTPRQGPAWANICAKFNHSNHFARGCRSKGRIHEVAAEESEGEEEFFFDSTYVGNVDAPNPQDSAWFSMIKVEGSPVKMKLDTGAATNLLPHKMFLKLNNQPQLRKSKAKLTAYGGHDIAYESKVILYCTALGKTQALEFYLTNAKAPPILGLQACSALGLIRRGDCNDAVHVETMTEPLTLDSI